jgi:hypothetical protein
MKRQGWALRKGVVRLLVESEEAINLPDLSGRYIDLLTQVTA